MTAALFGRYLTRVRREPRSFNQVSVDSPIPIPQAYKPMTLVVFHLRYDGAHLVFSRSVQQAGSHSLGRVGLLAHIHYWTHDILPYRC